MRIRLGILSAVALAALAVALMIPQSSAAESPPLQSASCPTNSTRSYVQGGVYQYDRDNPVRWAADNPDKNLKFRGIIRHELKPAGFVDYGRSSDNQTPPQLATLFKPYRVPRFSMGYRAFGWKWQPSPLMGGPLGDAQSLEVSVLGLATTPGEPLHLPQQSRSLGSPFGAGAIVLFADYDSITLKFTREDSVAKGYTLHVLGICPDPKLLALYNSLDNTDRNAFGPKSGNIPRDRVLDYKLPGVKSGQVFGTAAGTQILVAIRDNGSFIDPRSLRDWWRIHPKPK